MKEELRLNDIKGIGVKTLRLLSNIGINNIKDLLTYYPYRYELMTINDINNIKNDEKVIIEGFVVSPVFVKKLTFKSNFMTFKLNTNSKIINIIIFNRSFMKNNLNMGHFITVIGKYNELKNNIVASEIILGKINNNSINTYYHLVNGLTNKLIKKYMSSIIDKSIYLDDYIPEYLNEKYNFVSKNEAIKEIHFPTSLDKLKKSKVKLIYEELFEFMFKMNYLSIKENALKDETRDVLYEVVDEFINKLPFKLTKDQISSVKDIYKDMTSNKRMNRLLQGDVGSGKTIVSVIAIYINYLSGGQSVLMSPTEILASQHFENISKIFNKMNIKISFLVGKMKQKDRKQIINGLENGKIDLVIGTHALLNDEVNFKKLTLVVTDEQHRFGVNQRKILNKKGYKPDILYMSATPIPRTYALTLYGDMSISNIKTKPKGRKEVKTIIKSEKELKEVLYLMLEEIKKGRQIYVVSPLIEESEYLDEVRNVMELKDKMNIAFQNKIKIDIMHGKLTKEEKEEVMNKFISGNTKILISTTVIEVGLDVGNATMMVIFNAERFGLATLHQLRGRIGRNNYDSICVLIGPNSNERLKVLEESSDGFYITEKDFEMRREGDLFGIKQSGEMVFKIANLRENYKVLVQTKKDSNEFIKENMENNFKKYPLYYKIVSEINNLS